MKSHFNEEGSALLSMLILLVIAGVILASSLSASSSHLQTTGVQKIRTINFYSAESALHSTLNWLRDNSRQFIQFCRKENFYSVFDYTSPVNGENDDAGTVVPAAVFLNGTFDSGILASSDSVAAANFPSGVNKDLVYDFSSMDLGSSKARITLTNMLPDIPAKDYGDTDLGNADPETHFYPIMRLDTVTEVDEGAHLHALVTAELVQNKGVGFYGEDFVEMNQGCDSFDSSDGNYGGSNVKANCGVGSGGEIELHQSEIVYGTLSTKDAIADLSPWGGEICADFDTDCPNKGDACEGSVCELPAIPLYDPWLSYCNVDQGNAIVNSNQTFVVTSSNAIDKCWDNVDIRPNDTLTLTSTAYPYFIRTLDIANNSVLNLQPDMPGGKIKLYVEKIVGDKFNGNQIFNMNNTAGQFEIHYVGTDDLVLNGTADMKAFIIAPYANINVQGNFEYYGGIKAKGLTFTGNGGLHYDEVGQESKLINVRFRLSNIVQEYRL